MEGMRLMPKEKKRCVCMLLIVAMLFCMVGQSRVYVGAEEETVDGAETTEDSTETTTDATRYTYDTINDFTYTSDSSSKKYEYVYYNEDESKYEYTSKTKDEIEDDVEILAADMQPGESIYYKLPDDFVTGSYVLSVNSCGYRTSYTVTVTDSENNETTGTILRAETEFSMDDMTLDACDVYFDLEAGDTITITAPSDNYGWVEYVQLDKVYIYQAEDYYSGDKVGDGAAADMQAGESITITLGNDIDTGIYSLAVNSCGNRESFEIYVNGESVGTITRTGTGYGMDQMTLDYLSGSLALKSGDEITIKAEENSEDTQYYGWVDYMQLKKIPSYTYQAEDYYTGDIIEEVAADMQPGENIEIDLENSDFVAGTYALSVYSCGTRESFDVKVNEVSIGTLTRAATGYGQDQMTLDTLMVVSLSASDKITITAPDTGDSINNYWGWVDYIRLDPVSFDTAEDYITFEGGAIRVDDGSDTTSSLRFGYTITSALDDAEIYSWSWDLNYSSDSSTVSKTVVGNKYKDNGNSTYTSNVVITDIPEDYYTTDFNTLLTVVYTRSDGSKLTVIDDKTRTRTVYEVAKGAVGSETGDALAKVQQIISAVEGSN